MFKGDRFQQIMVDMKNPPLPVGVIGQVFLFEKNSWTSQKNLKQKNPQPFFWAQVFYSSLKKSPFKKNRCKKLQLLEAMAKVSHALAGAANGDLENSRDQNGRYEWQC